MLHQLSVYLNIYIYKLLLFNMYYKDFKYAENALHRKYFANTQKIKRKLCIA